MFTDCSGIANCLMTSCYKIINRYINFIIGIIILNQFPNSSLKHLNACLTNKVKSNAFEIKFKLNICHRDIEKAGPSLFAQDINIV